MFDENHRVYRRVGRELHDGGGGPIWREHWVKWRVEGETSRSWVLSNRRKVAKVGSDQRYIAFTEAEIDEQEWAQDHRYKILRAVEFLRDAAVLRQIAKLAGYVERPKD